MYTQIVEQYIKTIPKVELSDFWVKLTPNNATLYKRNEEYYIIDMSQYWEILWKDFLPERFRSKNIIWHRTFGRDGLNGEYYTPAIQGEEL